MKTNPVSPFPIDYSPLKTTSGDRPISENGEIWNGHQVTELSDTSSPAVFGSAEKGDKIATELLSTSKFALEEDRQSVSTADMSSVTSSTQPSPIVMMHAQKAVSIPKSKGPRGTRYEDLSNPKKAELKEKIFKENFRYAAYCNLKKNNSTKVGTENGIRISFNPEDPLSFIFWGEHTFNREELIVLNNINQGLKEMGFQADNQGFYYSSETGTIFRLIYDRVTEEINLCFLGLAAAYHMNLSRKEQNQLDFTALKAVISNSTGHISAAMIEAMKIGALLKKETEDSDIQPVIIGHSHGGSLAQVAAISSGLKGVIFNSEPVGHATKRMIDKEIGKEQRKIFTDNITAFSVKNDWLTDGAINAICRFGSDFGFSVPRVLAGKGRTFQLPTVGQTFIETHAWYYDAFNKLANK